MEDNFDIDKFTSLIKKKESIWNYKSAAYANKIQRRDDWLSVCESMVPDFEEKNDEEKSGYVLQMQTKWRVLRDGFTRSVKNYNEKLESGGKGKLYLYYEQLHFLHDLYTGKSTATHKSPGSSRLRKRRRINNTDDASDLDDERVAPNSTAKNGNIVFEDHGGSGMDADKQFLLSLLSDFRKIPEDLKLDAKGDIINIIRHYRSSTVQFDAKGSYYSTDIAALATTATDSYCEDAMIDNSSRESSPIEIKFSP